MLGLDAAAEITEEAFKGLLGKSKAEQEAAQSYNGLVGMKVLSLADGKEVEAEFSKETKVVKESFALVTTEKLAAVTSALATAQTEKTNLETQVTELKADADMGKTYLSLKREEVKRLYKTSVGEQFDVAVVALMDKANTTELDGLLKQYVKDSTGKFSGRCKSCGSGEFEFRSSFAGAGEEPTVEKKTVMTFSDLYSQNAKSSMSIGKTEDKK